MDTRSAEILNDMNCRFYAEHAESFSSTRQRPWDGWRRVLEHIDAPDRMLDLGSGNMRFQRYVDDHYAGKHITHYCIDSCDGLAAPSLNIAYQHLDVVSCLLSGRNIASVVEAPDCDVVTTFGFMHHIPGFDMRCTLFQALVEKTVPGGIIAISFWQFARDAKMRSKAEKTTGEAQESINVHLDENDYLIGWNGLPDVYRYCHSFDDEEITRMLESAKNKLKLIDCFSSDGKNNAMNKYVVLRN